MSFAFTYYVYILTNSTNSTLYIGLTNDLTKRVLQHKNASGSSFTKRYKINRLVYFEIHSSSGEAFKRERQLKKWNRAWKDQLITDKNPSWDDLADDW